MTDFSVNLVAADGSRLTICGEQKVGRSADCDITIDDARISRAHAILRLSDERLTVEDLASTNGTRVNELPTEGEVELADGDVLRFDKHRYVVAISGGSRDMDVTVMDSNATVVGIPAVAAARESAPEPKPEPEPESEAAPLQRPSPDLPGSWVDEHMGEHTRMISRADITKENLDAKQIERASDLPHLMVLGEDGARGEILELQPAGGSEADVWEIGREDNCEIVLSEPSVSARHAQLIHQDGRWRLVNLLSANGIFVNGEKRLTAYLTDGDEIRLGRVTLVFRAATGAATAAPGTAAVALSGEAKNRGLVRAVVIAAVVVLAIAGLWLAL